MLPVFHFENLIRFVTNKSTDREMAIDSAYHALGFVLTQRKKSSSGISLQSVSAGTPDDATAAHELTLLLQSQQNQTQTQPQPQPKEKEANLPKEPPQRTAGQTNLPPWLTSWLLQMLQKLLTT